jgi:hypothetical protein
MKKLQQLDKKLKLITEIFLDTRECYNYCRYFYTPQNDEELNLLNYDIHLQFIRHALWRQTVIEISKLICDKENDKFNINSFIRSLKPNGHYSFLKVPESKIKDWELSIINNIGVINNILKLRNKIFAHTDPNKEDYQKIVVTFSSIEKILKILTDILKEVYLAIHCDLDLSEPESENIRMLSLLVAHRKLEYNEIVRKYNER